MSARAKPSAGCVICGSKSIERNHVGGRNHVAWFTMPFCQAHHDQFHALLRVAGVDLEYKSDPIERGLRALEACWVAEWVIAQSLRKHLSEQRVKSHG
jgi:hypothetical protein